MADRQAQAAPLRLTAAGYYLIFGVLYLAGMGTGVLLLKSDTSFLSGFLQSAVDACFQGVKESSFQDIFLLLLLPALGQMLLVYLWGLWAAALPFTLTLFPLRGLGVGLLSAHLFMVYGTKGVWCYLLLFFPFQFLGACALFLGGKESIRLSLKLFRCLTDGAGEGRLRPMFQRYTARMLLFVGLAAGVAVLQTLLVFLFSRFFLGA